MTQWHITVGILILAFAPGLFWLAYFYSKDRLEPEPLYRVRNCFLIGMIVVVPAILVEKLTDFSLIFTLVVGAPIIEEYFKFVAVRYTIYESAEFDEPMDGIVYAAATALGFASVENALYLFREYYAVEGTLAGTTLLRAFVSVPGHALFSIMWGYALGLAKFSNPTKQKELVYTGLFLAIALHSLFNLLSFIGILWVIAMLIMVPLMWSAVHRRIERALQISQYADYPEFDLGTPKSGIVRNIRKGEPWFENRVLVVVLLFLVCFPIGLYGLWKNTKFSTPVKITYVALWIFITGMFAYQTYDHNLHGGQEIPREVQKESIINNHRK